MNFLFFYYSKALKEFLFFFLRLFCLIWFSTKHNYGTNLHPFFFSPILDSIIKKKTEIFFFFLYETINFARKLWEDKFLSVIKNSKIPWERKKKKKKNRRSRKFSGRKIWWEKFVEEKRKELKLIIKSFDSFYSIWDALKWAS